MKKIKIFALTLAGALFATSCDTYLDKIPDDRAEVNTPEKVASLLVSAYPEANPAFIMEMSSDNVVDNGRTYSSQENQEKAYRWEEITTVGTDDPRPIWGQIYTCVGTANEALDKLKTMEDNVTTRALRAEALLCRAYNMFMLSNVFCMSWNEKEATKYLGLPYPKEPGVSVDTRGTLKELYENINADIEEALPMVNDAHLAIPKYHFNMQAAYAFAARFNLYYQKWDKAIEYANKVLGNGQIPLRPVGTYLDLPGVDEIHNAYIRSGEPANLMLVTTASLMGRFMVFKRFNHSLLINQRETFWAKMPWGEGTQDNTLYEAGMMYGGRQAQFYPKTWENFEVIDKVTGSGFPRVVEVPFTTDETLLVRAEAYAMKNQVDQSLKDINTWIAAHCAESKGKAVRPTMTVESLNKFYDDLEDVPGVIKSDFERGIKKPLHPQGFEVAKGTQTNLIHMILQMRRIETFQQGLRFMDMKRYGLEICHTIEGEEPVTFKPGDLRGAIQLPADVTDVGLEKNPR